MQFISTMADDPEKNRLTRALHHIIVVLVVVPSIYILSVGPAIILVVKVPKLREPVHAVYAPHDLAARSYISEKDDGSVPFFLGNRRPASLMERLRAQQSLRDFFLFGHLSRS
jgi:hypothetical protein